MTRLVAGLLMVAGIGHALLGFMLFSTPLGEMLREGFVGTIRYGQFERATAFWFLLFAPACFLLGQLVGHAMERGDRWLLTVVAWNVLTIGVVGALIIPVSGFWMLIAAAPLVFHLARRLRTDSAALAGGAQGPRAGRGEA